MDEKRALLRHIVATVAYRGGKAVRDVPANFAGFSGDGSARTAVKIVAHIADLYDWALTQATGVEKWHDSVPAGWEAEVARFFASLQRFDDYLASEAPLAVSTEKLFQGGVADSLTHIGQLAMLRRLAGTRMKSENYARADIQVGRVGAEQRAPSREFD
jgi:hypothetical protein